MTKLSRPAFISATLWVACICLLLADQAGAHSEAYRLLLALAISSTVFAAIDRHRQDLAEIAALSYRAGTAARARSAGE